jgi:hypothetical protein
MTRGTEMFRKSVLSAGALSLALLTACDVTNPGPIQDEFLQGEPLSSTATQQGLINGAVREMAELVSDGSYTQALLAREIFPGGQTGSTGHNVITQGGHLLPGDDVGNWGDAVSARFIAETAIKRFDEVEAPNNMKYQAQFWAGYAYSFLGRWWCEAVVTPLDPESAEPGTHEPDTRTVLQRAQDSFTKALQLASNDTEKFAALAGRAQVRVFLNDWAGAAADAAQVPDDFVQWITFDALETAYQNAFWEAQSGVFRSFSVIHTFADTYYTQTGDPRMKWDRDPEYPLATASLQGYSGGPAGQRASVPYYRQRKYVDRGDDQRLSSGWEMRLIEAEAKLRASPADIAGAMALVNKVHTRITSETTNQRLAPVSASTAEEAWSALKRERLIELWLEGHRLADERRWAATQTPGNNDTPNFETRSTLFTQNPRTYCFDIPDSERDLNPNVPGAGG